MISHTFVGTGKLRVTLYSENIYKYAVFSTFAKQGAATSITLPLLFSSRVFLLHLLLFELSSEINMFLGFAEFMYGSLS